MQKLLSIFVYLVLLVFLESAAQVTGVTASAPAEIPADEPRYVALTFDDGPRRSTTARLLDGLRERGASATFFLVGEQLAGNEDLIRRMAQEGHQIGNHTWDHVRLQGDEPAHQIQEIQDTDKALTAILGGSGYWLRPPYGLIDQEMKAQIPVPMVQWSVDPRDWATSDTAAVERAVLKNVKDGDIVLLHDMTASSVQAALDIVDVLKNQGYEIVTVSALVKLRGVKLKPGKTYTSFPAELK